MARFDEGNGRFDPPRTVPPLWPLEKRRRPRGIHLAEQIAMRARAFKTDVTTIFSECVYQQPIGFDMAVAAAREVPP